MRCPLKNQWGYANKLIRSKRISSKRIRSKRIRGKRIRSRCFRNSGVTLAIALY